MRRLENGNMLELRAMLIGQNAVCRWMIIGGLSVYLRAAGETGALDRRPDHHDHHREG
jgi:hypothetical protein